MPRRVGGSDPDRVSSRLLGFVLELIRHAGGDPRTVVADLETIDQTQPWIAWADYITAIERFGALAGGATGVAAAMRTVARAAYSDLRALAGFFAGPIPFHAFVTHQLNRELVPGSFGQADTLDANRVHLRYRISDELVGSLLFFQGTVTLTELFPTHFGQPEARVEIVELTDRTLELIAIFPKDKPKVRWGAHLEPESTTSLTKREQEVLQLVCEGLTNAEIASALGTAASTVKTQISSILAKMEVANRTELAALAARRP
ncbi:MAG: response regulator transcription factor [Kofleriaceae bacterium]